jgi:PHP family Zn ribbon phosphoesterase
MSGGLFGFLTQTCIRCEAKYQLIKLTDDVWMCFECLKQSRYKSFWNKLTSRVIEICDSRQDQTSTYEVLMKEATAILNLRILADSGLITEEEFVERTTHFFEDLDMEQM